jgi:hypothetical protein
MAPWTGGGSIRRSASGILFIDSGTLLAKYDTLWLIRDFAPADGDDQRCGRWLRFPPSLVRPQNRVIMSVLPRPWPEVPAGTAAIARKAFRRGTLAIRARDELGAWYDDEAFAGA